MDISQYVELVNYESDINYFTLTFRVSSSFIKGKVGNIGLSDLGYNLINSNQNFTSRFRGVSYKLEETNGYYYITINMKCLASNKSFNVDVIPKIKNILTVDNLLWWNSSFSYYRMLTIHEEFINQSLVNFPVLVVINNTIGTKSDAFLKSIRFVGIDNITQYYREIDFYNSTDKSGYVWVNLTWIDKNTDTRFIMYYNNSAVDSNGGLYNSSENTFNKDYVLVLHGTGANALAIDDSTSYSNDVVGSGSTPDYNMEGKIGKSFYLDATSSEYLSIKHSASLNLTTAFTIEVLEKHPSVTGTSELILCKGAWDTCPYALNMHSFYTPPKFAYELYSDAHGLDEKAFAVGTWNTNTWYHLTWRKDPGSVKGFFSNVLKFTSAYVSSLDTNSKVLNLGSDSVGSRWYRGYLDEIRISKVSRNTSWIMATYNTSMQTSGFLTWGTETSNAPPTKSLLYPANNSIDICLQPTIRIWANDTDSPTLNIYFSSNSSGAWVLFQSNISFSSNNIVRANFTNASSQLHKYYFRVTITDGKTIITDWYCFTTAIIDTVCPTHGSTNNSNKTYNIVWCIYLSDNSGSFDYNISCNNSQYITDSNVANGTYCIWLKNLSFNTSYIINVNQTDGICWENNSYTQNLSIGSSIPSSMEITLASDQFSIIITFLLFIFFLWIGYTVPKRSAGAFMLLSGMCFLSLDYLLVSIINQPYIGVLIAPFGIFIILLGIRKFLFFIENDKIKGESE